MAVEKLKERTLSQERMAAIVSELYSSKNFWHAMLLFLASLSLLSAIPFFPPILIPFISLLPAAFGWLEKPQFGLILMCLLGVLSSFYQSPGFGLVFLLFFSLVVFEAFSRWQTLTSIILLVFLPFAQFPFSLLSGLWMLFLMVFALHIGSSEALKMAVFSIMFIGLFTALTGMPNSAFITVSGGLYEKSDVFSISKPPASLLSLGDAFDSIASSPLADTLSQFNEGVSVLFSNLITLLFSDFLILDILVWSVSLFTAAYVSGRLKKRGQLIGSFALLLPVSVSFALRGDPSVFAYAAISILSIAYMESRGIKVSMEKEISIKKRVKKFGKFGLQDLSFSPDTSSIEDVGNYDSVKQELKDAIILPLERKDVSHAYGLKPARGILLFGPPGTGKTMLMRALAKRLDYGFYYVRSSDILSQWYGESERNLRELFRIARKNSPCILFFDEIDALAKKRTEFGTDDVGPRVLATFLQELDGFGDSSNVVTIGATNVPNKLDPALLRPGRFDKIIYMPLPDKNGRKEIFRVHLSKLPVSDDINLDELAEKSERFSGADISNVVKEAKSIAAKEALSLGRVVPISQRHLLSVLSLVKPSVSLSEIEKYERFKLDFERTSVKKEKPNEERKVRWKDVAGLEDVKKAFLEAVELPLKHEDLVKKYGVSPSRGILLFGPPGTGKTLIVKAASSELDAAFINIDFSELVKYGAGRAVEMIRKEFDRARENAPAIIFLDELESIALSRSSSPSLLLSELLSQMDGVKSSEGVVVVGATNKPSMLDPALLRPGRFEKIFYVPLPDSDTRKEIFRIHLGKFSKGIDLDILAEKSEGFSGADIASVCTEVKMEAVRMEMRGESPKITTDMVINVLSSRRPSISKKMLAEYTRFLENYGERR